MMINIKSLTEASKICFMFKAVMILVSDYDICIVSKQYSFTNMFYTHW